MPTNKIANQILIIFGASGDLTYRKLIPAIFDLYKQNSLPEKFSVLGVSRTPFTDDSFREKMKEGILKFSGLKPENEDELNKFCNILHYLPINTAESKDYSQLTLRLKEIDKNENTQGNYIFYLSTPPSLYGVIPKYLAAEGLNIENNCFRRIIIEKPFGTDLKSAIELNSILKEDYKEEQIYRIDHYLGKETVQNLLVTRFANGIYEPLWNRNYIHHVEITAAESIGIENRGGYYDHSGALRDMVQNHLMQLLALVAMEPPMSIDATSIRNEKLKVFQALRPMKDDDLFKNVVRGQYLPSNTNGNYYKGYREEKDVAKDSRTETYVALKLFIDNWRWADVPFYIRTGKRLPTRVSEIVIHFRPAPQNLFPGQEIHKNNDNQLILRIQPDEGVSFQTKMKIPGSGYRVKNVNMDFHYSQLHNVYLPDAYERLLLDCMMGDPTLYIDSGALEATWKFVQPLLDFWKNNTEAPLYGYPAGSWGPENADRLIEGENKSFRYPCKNLSNDENYCEL
ncbi:glucose-6-phosphate dehydrogenase [Apibacter muscae]|uniref:glucose-6-phosphate dehydrogenase n=1 Tax=Apibacter muscae TaxID=2509004 RepID=UPI0011ABFC11|nr:glucose-6-phosphate dehydrogenase [Apibacter muscae]TWP28162.1 glucose-6-phosphate dehydrogenase [Apibacter muscae]